MPLKLNSSGGGSVTLDVPVTASAFNVIVPANAGTVVTTGSTAAVTQGMLASGVAGNGPAFSAYRSSAQSITNSTFTKVVLNSENFDTANAFDTSNGRFTPQVAGYYQFNFQYGSGQSGYSLFCEARKNNSRFAISSITSEVPGIGATCSGSGLIYLNGSTDYVELFVYQNSAGAANTTVETLMSGFLARAA